MIRRDLRPWILWAGVVFAVLAGASVWWIRALQHAEAFGRADAVVHTIRDQLTGGASGSQGPDTERLQETVGALSTGLGVDLLVTEPSGEPVARSRPRDWAQSEAAIPINDLEVALADGLHTSLRTADGGRGPVLFVSRAVYDRGRPAFVVRVGVPLSVVGNSRGQLVSAWVLIGAAFAAIGLATAALSRVMTRAERRALQRGLRGLVSGDTRVPDGQETGLIDADLLRSLLDLRAHLQAMESRIAGLEAEQQATLRAVDGGVVIIDVQQRVLNMNRAAEWMLGVTASHAKGRLLQEAARQSDLNRFALEALERGDLESAELVLRGEPERRVNAAAARLIDRSGRVAGLLLVINDITQLRRLQSVRTDFASNVSHELRTPITNIKGYIETLLESGLEDREQSMAFLRTVQRNADRLGAIVEDMLMLTQLERPDARTHLETEAAGVRGILEHAEQELEGEVRSKGTRVLIDASPELKADLNPPLVQMAVNNLLANAVRYSASGKRVWLAAGRVTGQDGREMIEISVKDEGPGIAPEHLSRVFERFYRVDKARSRSQGGTGLGLAIVKHIAQLHGGGVEVESRVGLGSRFSILIPLSIVPGELDHTNSEQ